MQLSLFSISLFCILVFLSLSKHLIIMKVCMIRKQILVPSHAVWPGLGPRRPRLGGAAAALLVLPLVLLPTHLFLLLLAVTVHNVPPSLRTLHLEVRMHACSSHKETNWRTAVLPTSCLCNTTMCVQCSVHAHAKSETCQSLPSGRMQQCDHISGVRM